MHFMAALLIIIIIISKISERLAVGRLVKLSTGKIRISPCLPSPRQCVSLSGRDSDGSRMIWINRQAELASATRLEEA